MHCSIGECFPLPDDWRIANVSPVYKKGQMSLAENYRPISLTSVCCKMIEHILASKIMKHGEENIILYPLQHGFLKGRSCETQLIEFVDGISKNLQEGQQTYILTVFRLLTDFVCLYTYGFWLSLCKIVRSSVILLVPLLDFAKGFDKVNHSILIHKLQHNGIIGKSVRGIQNWLANRKQSVVIDGSTSDAVSVNFGVPQSSVLGPGLFLYYINDLNQD